MGSGLVIPALGRADWLGYEPTSWERVYTLTARISTKAHPGWVVGAFRVAWLVVVEALEEAKVRFQLVQDGLQVLATSFRPSG